MLGVDPGFVAAGFAVIKIPIGKKPEIIDLGIFKQSSSLSIQERLGRFFTFFHELARIHKVSHICLETPFLGKNAQNFLKLGYLRGALNLIAYQLGLGINELSPRAIKSMVTGYGHADKEQVAKALEIFFPGLRGLGKVGSDATDALAAALSLSLNEKFF